MKKIIPILILSVLAVLTNAACTKNYFLQNKSSSDSSTAPTPTPTTHTIEYRVLGTVQNVEIKAFAPNQDGTLLANTQPPWSIDYRTTVTSAFLFISATSNDAGTLQVQIWIDGKFFREAVVSQEFAFQTPNGIIAAISGTFDLTSIE